MFFSYVAAFELKGFDYVKNKVQNELMTQVTPRSRLLSQPYLRVLVSPKLVRRAAISLRSSPGCSFLWLHI